MHCPKGSAVTWEECRDLLNGPVDRGRTCKICHLNYRRTTLNFKAF